MKKIAILTCLRKTKTCAGCACLDALYERCGTFSVYESDLRLVAFFHCSCCVQDGETPEQDAGFQKKVNRLIKDGVEAVHIGMCSKTSEGTECPGMTAQAHELENRGVAVIWGTHPPGYNKMSL